MVKLVNDTDKMKMTKDLKREQANMHICLNPYITPEQERIAMKRREGAGSRPDQLLFKMRKAKIEATVMAPTFAEDNVKHLAHNVSWEV